MPFTGSLGSLASGHQQPVQPSIQGQKSTSSKVTFTDASDLKSRQHSDLLLLGTGLSAAIPPGAYLMAQGHPLQQPYPLAAGGPQEKRVSKKEESAFGLVGSLQRNWGLSDTQTSVLRLEV